MTENIIFQGLIEDLAEKLSIDPERIGVLRELVTLKDLVGLEVLEEHGEPEVLKA